MSEERLQEIKDSIEFQYTLAKAKGYDNALLFTNEEEELVEEIEKLQEQLSSNTLQLEKLKKQVNKGLYNVCLPYKTGYDKAMKDKEIQQKEFISYLEDEINKLKEQIKNYDLWHEVGTDINFLILKKQFYLTILQKYKEIIGDDKE